MLSELLAGIRRIREGAQAGLRGNNFGALVVTDAHGRYTEQALQGNIFMLDSDAVTIASAHTTKGALGTIKLINGFYNPIGSGFNAAILNANVSTVSGTPAGPMFLNYLTGVNISTASAGVIKAALLSGMGKSAMNPQVSTVLASATPTATAAAVQLGVLGGQAAIAAGAGNYHVSEDIAGRIIVPPGCVFGITAVGAGSSHVVQSTIAWEELPI